jgi:RimJ/RimL family protein N-acetyltransferase
MNISFIKLTQPTLEIAEASNKWENDPALIPFIRPNRTKDDLERLEIVTVESLARRLDHDEIYLIYSGGQLVGEMNYQADPKHLYKKESGTAWIGINIGEESARGKGIGAQAMKYLEKEINARGFQRIELGVFAFNTNAIKLYQKLGYQEIARIEDFTFWQDRFWQDIRMEKYLK